MTRMTPCFIEVCVRVVVLYADESLFDTQMSRCFIEVCE